MIENHWYQLLEPWLWLSFLCCSHDFLTALSYMDLPAENSRRRGKVSAGLLAKMGLGIDEKGRCFSC